MSANTATPSPQGEMIVGIDLGTTHSLVAYCDESGPHCIADEQGRTLLPSVVRYDPTSGQVTAIGYEARKHAVEYPLTTLFSIKRLMGRGIEDVQGELAYLPYPVVAGDHHTARVRLGDDAQARVVSPQEVSAVILAELRRWATRHFGRPVRKAVITVPAYFDDAQRQATRDAGRLAGLEVVRIVNEPTAASLAYNLGLHAVQAGGTGNATGNGDKVGLSLSGKRSDGTIALNTKINPAVCTSGPDATAPATAASTPTNASGAVGSGGGGETVAVFDLGGGTFDFSILKLQTTAAGVVDQVLGTAGDTHLGGDDVDRMIVELIQREIRTQFGGDIEFPPATRQAFRNLAEATKIRLSDHDQSEMEIDLGGGRQYRRTLTKGELETMMIPWVDQALACCRTALQRANLPATAMQRVILVGGSTRVPLVRQRVREYFQSEPYTALNPDEVVALGAAVQAAILAGVHRGMLLLDVIPLSLGIETLGGAVAKLIVANTTIPARATEKFTTYVDGQTKVSIHVLQGERELVQDCRSLGRFDLTGVPPMPAGLPKIEVTFLVDANGVLNVSAIEQRSGKAASLQVVPNHGLTREEVARMEAQSLAHAKEDMDAHRLIDLRNQARLDMRNIERQLARVGKNLDADTRAKIDAAMNKVREFTAAAAPNADEFYQVLTDMDHATIRLAELAIKQSLTEEGLMEAPKSE